MASEAPALLGEFRNGWSANGNWHIHQRARPGTAPSWLSIVQVIKSYKPKHFAAISALSPCIAIEFYQKVQKGAKIKESPWIWSLCACAGPRLEHHNLCLAKPSKQAPNIPGRSKSLEGPGHKQGPATGLFSSIQGIQREFSSQQRLQSSLCSAPRISTD